MPYSPADNCLQDRIILVTGASSGLGEVAAKAFAEHGATVVLLGRKVAKLERVYDDIVAAGGPEPAIYPLNMEGASNDDYLDLANTIEENFGRLDGLLHNAAAVGELTPLALHSVDIWYKTFQVNLNAPFMLTQACLPLLKASDNGSVIFTDHECAEAFWGAYGVSKAAARNLAEKLALECDGKPRVNLISPGALASPMRSRAYPGDDITKLPQMEDVMPSYLKLMDPTATPVNGQLVDAQSYL